MDVAAPALARADSRAILVVSWLAAIGLALTLAGLGIQAFQISTADTVTVPGVELSSTEQIERLTGGPVTATTSTVDVDVDDAPASVRSPLIAAVAVSALTPLAVTGVLFFTGRQLATQRFRRSLATGVAVLATVAFASGLFAPFLRAMAGSEALKVGPLGADAPFVFSLSAEAITIPALLLMVAALLIVSERLQKETEGLV